jgi:YHS domain-containing protein
MLRSIQEFLRKINSYLNESLTFIDFMAIIGVILGITGFFTYSTVIDLYERSPVTYIESSASSSNNDVKTIEKSSLIIASKNGKTYYYSWCKGVERIKSENKITFQNEDIAKATGRRLASGCK